MSPIQRRAGSDSSVPGPIGARNRGPAGLGDTVGEGEQGSVEGSPVDGLAAAEIAGRVKQHVGVEGHAFGRQCRRERRQDRSFAGTRGSGHHE